MKIAIVGAGYAGCALAWFLSEAGADVTVFDRGGGASRASTGLLHKRPGKKGEVSWRGDEGMQAALELLKVASRKRPCFVENGLVRCLGNEVYHDPDGCVVFSRVYLEELKKMTKARFVEGDAVGLEAFDHVVWANGHLAPCEMKRTIGQALLCKWQKPLEMSLLGDGHITPTEDPRFCLVGSTYEHTEVPDEKKAYQLLEKVADMYPPARDFEIVEVRWGVRAAPKVGYKPIVTKNLFTGFGSRGLLYHAMLAKELSWDILHS